MKKIFQNIIALSFFAVVLLCCVQLAFANGMESISERNEAMISFLPKTGIKAAGPVQCNVSLVNAEGEVSGYQPAMYVEKDTSSKCYQEIMMLTKSLTAGCAAENEKARAIQEWVSRNITYGTSIGIGNTIEQVYRVYEERSAHCMGYSYLTGLMLYMAGIPNGCVVTTGHMWNIALLDGKWVMIDSTWDAFDFSYQDAEHGKITMICFGDGNLCLVIDNPKDGVKLAGAGANILDRNDVEEVVVPDYVTQILGSSMSNCTNLNKVVIGSSVHAIDSQIFFKCKMLKKILIPPNVKTIADDALKGSGVKFIYGQPGTEAQAYAERNGFLFKDMDAEPADSGSDDEECLKILGISETKDGVQVHWNQIEGITEYTLFYKCAAEDYHQSVITKDSTSCIIPYYKMQPDKVYEFYIAAFLGSKCMFESETVQYSVTNEAVFVFTGTSIVGNIVPEQKGFTVKWKKQQTAAGYQIQYACSSNFTGKTTVTKEVKNREAAKMTVRNLKAKKKYYVRIRTFQLTDGKKNYSHWSASRSVVTI